MRLIASVLSVKWKTVSSVDLTEEDFDAIIAGLKATGRRDLIEKMTGKKPPDDKPPPGMSLVKR